MWERLKHIFSFYNMENLKIKIGLAVALAFLCSCASAFNITTVETDSSAIILNGKRKVIFSGAIHYPRSTVSMWPDLIRKASEGGLDAIETYIFWNRHEPRRREYDFTGNLDFVRFLKTVQDAGLYAVLRIGPYVCAEWTYGGLPVWLHNIPGIALRTNNTTYQQEMQIFVAKIVDMCRQNKLFAPQGGPIIFTQIENEYGNVMYEYGEAGKSYVNWCAQMASGLNVGVPWVMCQQEDAPAPMINTCNGWYCDEHFKPNNPKSPKMWTENWTGWFTGWGDRKPHRTAEDLAYSVARFFQTGGVFVNYYMYHGGTNFGRTAGGPYIATTYDYDAPLDEYGNYNQPKWGHLKNLHDAIKSVADILTNSNVENRSFPNTVNLTTFTSKANGKKVCFLSNQNTTSHATVDLQQDGTFFVPAWSVSILADCKTEIHNTAKVVAQTNIMTKKPASDDPSVPLAWAWREEPMQDVLKGKGKFAATELLEQKATTVDASDYLWYMTRVDIEDPANWKNATLRVNTTGQVLHAFVNGKLIGSQWGKNGEYNFTFEKNTTLNMGTNVITLLSGTVGFRNYGGWYDTEPDGINGGPVELIGAGYANVDLSGFEWTYKIGLDGEDISLFADQPSNPDDGWTTDGLTILKPFTWYKTTFQTPVGEEPVALDLQGMGKGHAWVNGRSIGRFWPSFLAPEEDCTDVCDYAGPYDNNKCLTNCGNPSQRWYHIPRSFLKDDNNTLVLFEEAGGNPTQVSLQTVVVSNVCLKAFDGTDVKFSCPPGRTISQIQFATFGDVQGDCGAFTKGACDSANTLSVIQKTCVGYPECAFNVSENVLGKSNCAPNITKKLAVQAIC